MVKIHVTFGAAVSSLFMKDKNKKLDGKKKVKNFC